MKAHRSTLISNVVFKITINYCLHIRLYSLLCHQQLLLFTQLCGVY